MNPDAADISVPRAISALLSNERLILRETQRAVTPLGGATVFVVFLQKLGLVEKLRQHMPIQWKSPNRIDPTTTFTAFLVGGARIGEGTPQSHWKILTILGAMSTRGILAAMTIEEATSSWPIWTRFCARSCALTTWW